MVLWVGEGEGSMQPQRTTVNIIGGTSTDLRVIEPPWQTEQADLVLVAVTAWGNSADNLIYGSVDGNEVLQGALNLLQEDHGFVFVVSGAGTIPLPHIPIRVSTKITIQPAPASNGQIFLMYYWQAFVAPLSQLDIPLPLAKDKEDVHTRRLRQETALWNEMKPEPPANLLRTEPEELTPHQKELLRRHQFLVDTKGQKS